MSRKATNAYIGTKRRAYAQANRARRSRILDEVCETTGYERKYANRLLTGNRKFRERKGRGKTYGDDVAEVLKRVWREAGWARGNKRSGRGAQGWNSTLLDNARKFRMKFTVADPSSSPPDYSVA